MEIHNFYLPSLRKNQKIAKIKGEEFFHLKKVLRLSLKNKIMLFNGKGIVARGEIKDISSYALININSISYFPKKDFRIILLQSIIKKNKMDFIIKKATELGVDTIIPIISENCVVKINDSDKLNKIERWNKIIIQAGKQSRNPWFPELISPLNLEQALNLIDSSYSKFIFTLKSKASIRNILGSLKRKTSILIGPEGGFNTNEIKLAEDKNFIPLSLGKLRLRSETASIYAISLIKTLWMLNNG